MHLQDVDGAFDETVTHVVSPPAVRTIKTLSAAVLQRWIVHPDWVRESHEKKRFVEESKFGFRQEDKLFANKFILYSKKFLEETQKPNKVPNKHTHCDLLIKDLGKGTITTNLSKAHYVIITSGEKASEFPGKTVLNWENFIELIFPKKMSPSQ